VYGGPVAAGPGPGCATCFAGPDAAHVPVSATAPVFSAPLPAPASTPLGPPTVHQTTEPPMATKPLGKDRQRPSRFAFSSAELPRRYSGSSRNSSSRVTGGRRRPTRTTDSTRGWRSGSGTTVACRIPSA
jgi:hypothetical protein